MEDTLISETPWAWYLVRSSGIIALLLLYLSLFLGLAVRTPILKDHIRPVYSVGAHCFLASQSLFFSSIHSLALLFDKYLDFSVLDVFVPFYSGFSPGLMALGILGLYILIIMVLTSYFRKVISWKLWRISHYLYAALFPVVFIHSFYLGTDLKSPIVRTIFLILGIALALLLAARLLFSNSFHRT